MIQATFGRTMNGAHEKLTFGQVVAVVLLLAPPFVSYFFDTGPSRWLIDFQESLIGGHFPTLTFLALLFLEFLFIGIVGLTVRALTGRTIVQIFTGQTTNDE